MILKGRVWKYGDNVNTDLIYPGRFLKLMEGSEMAEHALECLDPSFAKNVKKGDMLVAGRNFGCGSSREQAVRCLKEAGVRCVVAESFARIFYRNAVNSGLPVLVCHGLCEKVESRQTIEVELEKGTVRNLYTGEVVQGVQPPGFILEIIKDGGLVPHLRKRLGLSKTQKVKKKD